MADRVMVTGSDGYIGTVLCRVLSDSYDVLGLDAGFYRDAYLYAPTWDLPPTRTNDIRDVTVDDLVGVTAVVCLSDLTDPLSVAYPDAARQINRDGVTHLADTAKAAEVARFVYSSSASVYGRTDSTPVSENSPLQPLTPYAEHKAAVEQHLLALADDGFSVTCLRNATVLGLSPRIRLDLVGNYLCASAAAAGSVELASDGAAWRPFVHIDDVCHTIAAVLEMSPAEVNRLVVNVGDATGNLTVRGLADIVSTATDCEIRFTENSTDARSYRIDTGLLNGLGIHCSRRVDVELERMVATFRQLDVQREHLHARGFCRVSQMRHLIATGQVDSRLARVLP